MSITAIIQSYIRQENIPILIDALRKQTIKPERIIVWNDNDGSGTYLSDLGEDVEIINTNTNYNGNYGAFIVGYLVDSDYIAIIDDDCYPNEEWFEFCINNIKEKEVFGGFGGILRGNKYTGRRAFTTKIRDKILFRKVDFVGNTYFLPKQALLPMFLMRPPFWHNNVDLHFSFLAKKRGWKLLVPHVKYEKQLPFSKDKLVYGKAEKAMSIEQDHLKKRDDFVRWAIRRKILRRKE